MISYIGVDLGQKGAITIQSKLPGSKYQFDIIPLWAHHGGTRLRAPTENEMYDIIRNILKRSGETYVAIEHPIFMPLNGKKAIASLHENFGLMKGLMIASGASHFWYPKPREWKTLTKANGDDKSAMTKFAARLTRHKNLNDMTSDSVLISEACRLHFK